MVAVDLEGWNTNHLRLWQDPDQYCTSDPKHEIDIAFQLIRILLKFFLACLRKIAASNTFRSIFRR